MRPIYDTHHPLRRPQATYLCEHQITIESGAKYTPTLEHTTSVRCFAALSELR
ncbi:hypothetical protein M3J09_009433 [Ascochyta lentis]